MNARAFVCRNTVPSAAALVPELILHLATDITPIWQATEDWLHAHNVEPPFWAFAWPGGIVMARYILDNPATAAGRRVLDFAAGCGIAGLAAAQAGAAHVDAAEIDPLAIAAIELNADRNGLRVHARCGDVVGTCGAWDLILAGDVCYEAPMTRHILPWLQGQAARAEIWIADPGRAYLPLASLRPIATYEVPTSLELEDRLTRTTTIYRLLAAA